MIRLALLPFLLILSACDGVWVGYGGYDPYYYDYGFRHGIYDVHHDIDVDINRPDRPRPPPGAKPERPRPPAARPERPRPLPGHRPSRPPRRMR